MGLRVLYVARHLSGGADDEGAVQHAFNALSHNVVAVQEHDDGKILHEASKPNWCDFLLMNKWSNHQLLSKIKIAKVCYFWDLVDWPRDASLARRCEERKQWMARTVPLVDLMFCTDGDWVAQDTSGKLHYLPQGADGRITGRGQQFFATSHPAHQQGPNILFTGIAGSGGVERASFVKEMRDRWGNNFQCIERGTYREHLQELIARTKIVVAPDSPVTHRYASNRIYNTLGFGGFLLHPYSDIIAEQYKDGQEIRFYNCREHLHVLIRDYLQLDGARALIQEAGLKATVERHLYQHRVAEMVRIIGERLGVK